MIVARAAAATTLLAVALACGGSGTSPETRPAEAPPTDDGAPLPERPAADLQSRTLCTVDEEVVLSCFPLSNSPIAVLSICAAPDTTLTTREGVLGKIEHQTPPRPQPQFNPIDWYDVEPGPDEEAEGAITLGLSMGYEPWTLVQDEVGLTLTKGRDGDPVTCTGTPTGSLDAVRDRIRPTGAVGRPPVDGSTPP